MRPTYRPSVRSSIFVAALAAALPLSAFAGVSAVPSTPGVSTATPGPVHLLDKGDKADKGDKPRKQEARTEKEDQQDAMMVIADAADRMVSPDGLPRVVELVANSDRERIESGVKKADLDKLNAAAKEFGVIWREKFNSGFDATNNLKQLNGTRVDIRDGDGDRKNAFIYFPAFGGWKPFEMHLTRFKDSTWRIQLPNNLSAEKLVKESTHDVQKLVDDKDRWFKDEHINYNSAVTQLVHAMAFPSEGDRKEKN